MFDTLAASQELTQAGLNAEQAAAITHTVQRAVEHGDHVTSDQFKAGLADLRTEIAGHRAEVTGQIAEVTGQIAEQRAEIAEVRTEIASLETRLIKWIVGTAIAAAIATASVTTVLLRILGLG